MTKIILNKLRIQSIFELIFIVGIVGLIMLGFPVDTKAYDEIVIVIDPGHGGPITGNKDDTNGGAMYHDLIEKDVNLVTAKALRDELVQYGNVTCYLTREIDAALTLEDRVNFAEEVGADMFISVHYNASADHNFYGSEIFTSAFGECYAKGHALAGCIMKEWVDFGNTEKDIKTRIGSQGKDYYGVIRIAESKNIPAIILEHGYLDNDHDYLRINKESAWRELGVADAKGIAKYYGLEKDTVKESVGPTVSVDVPDEPVVDDTTPPTGVKLTIDFYNSNKGDIEFTLAGYDDESKLMYYGFVLEEADDETVFPELELWTGKNGKMTGSYHIQPGYEGPITAAVFNVYQSHTISNIEKLIPDESLPDDEEDNALISDDGDGQELEITNEIILDNNNSEAGKSWEIGGTDEKALNEAMANAIENKMDSKVDNSFKKLIVVGLVAAMVLAVTIVLVISASAGKKKRRKRRQQRERKSYDWMDDDYE